MPHITVVRPRKRLPYSCALTQCDETRVPVSLSALSRLCAHAAVDETLQGPYNVFSLSAPHTKGVCTDVILGDPTALR